jgi:hypothetical protein
MIEVKREENLVKFIQQTKLAIPASMNQVKFKQDMVRQKEFHCNLYL